MLARKKILTVFSSSLKTHFVQPCVSISIIQKKIIGTFDSSILFIFQFFKFAYVDHPTYQLNTTLLQPPKYEVNATTAPHRSNS